MKERLKSIGLSSLEFYFFIPDEWRTYASLNITILLRDDGGITLIGISKLKSQC